MNKELTQDINHDLLTLNLKNKEEVQVYQAEHILSLAAGMYLLYSGLKSMDAKPFIGLQRAAAGGILIYRSAAKMFAVQKLSGSSNPTHQPFS